ncbi:MAG: VaFE repeat-containing surface-anchored protein [Lachnospiraceae bacterium]|nr:VaFE repeat-containing surface-anchored protein [Lachnospiraceae bacterium]
MKRIIKPAIGFFLVLALIVLGHRLFLREGKAEEVPAEIMEEMSLTETESLEDFEEITSEEIPIEEVSTEQVTEEETSTDTEDFLEVTESFVETEESFSLEEMPLLERVKGKTEEETYEILLEYSIDEVLDAYIFLSGGIDPEEGPLYENFEGAKDRFLEAMAPRRMMLMAKTTTGGTASVTAYSKLTAANDPSGSKLNVGSFTVNDNGSSMQALCLHHALTYPPTGTSLTVLETAEVTRKDKGSWEYDYARLIYYMYINKTTADQILTYMYNNHKYSPDPLRGPFQRHMNPTDSIKDDYYRIMVTLACSYLNGLGTGGNTTSQLRYTSTKDYDDYYDIGAAVWTVLNDTSVLSNSDLPDGITVKLSFMYPGSTAQQPLMAWDSYETPAAKVSVTKTSGNTTITNGNSNYKLTGITYGLYTTSACTTLAKTKEGTDAILTIKADGSSNVLNMKDGTYYLKERTVPSGCNYALSTAVTTLTLEPGETKVVNTSDAPLFDTVGVTIQKVSANGGSYNLSGAEYTVKYYAGQYTKNNLPSTATASWVIKTIKSGSNYVASLDDAHKVSGDSAKYGKESNGTYRIPLGTITVEETKAPTGFLREGATMQLLSGNGSDASEGIFLINIVGQNSQVVVKSGNQTDSNSSDGFGILSKEIPIAKISTTATDVESGTHEAKVGDNIQIKDTVTYENLIPGKAYLVTGTLRIRETGEVFKVNGNTLTVTKTFTPTSANGSVELIFPVDARSLSGKTLVVFEELSTGGKVVATHQDLNDDGQSVKISEVKTLKIEKQVTGNMGNKTQEFVFHIQFVKGASLPESLPYLKGEEEGELVVAENAVTFSLMHGEEIVIGGLPSGISYVITEERDERYLTYVQMGENTKIQNHSFASVLQENTSILFENNREVGIPTGQTIREWPIWCSLAGAAAVSFYFLLRRRETFSR